MKPGASISERLFAATTSVRLTIVTLLLIAATSALGTLIKQRGTEEEYLALYEESTYQLIRFFGFDDIYHSFWFFFLLVLFATNLALCTIRRVRRRIERRGLEEARNAYSRDDPGSGFTLPFGHKEEVTRRIAAKYKVVRETEAGVIYERGATSRYGVLVVHASILVILVGGFIGLVGGYKGFVFMRSGEEKGRIVLKDDRHTEIPLGFKVRCKEFRVTHYPSGEPKEYVSTLEVIEEGVGIVLEREIRVNQPLSYKGLRFYQSTYGKERFFAFNINGKKALLAERDVYGGSQPLFMVVRFVQEIHGLGPGVMVAYLDGREPKTIWFLRDVEEMKTHDILGKKISLEGIKEEYYTGLEVSRDPGIPIVLAGFALLVFGLYINFFISRRRIYVTSDGKVITVDGTTTRNREAFAEELKKITKGLS